MEDLFKIGIITSTHGIKGEVKVFPTGTELERFRILKQCILKQGRTQIDLEVEGCKFFKNQAILKFKGYDNINLVEGFKQGELWVTREHAVPLEEDEFYIADILNAPVYLESGEEFGVLCEVMETGANDVYVIKTKEGKEILIPAIPDCILEVQVEEPRLTIRLLKGLME